MDARQVYDRRFSREDRARKAAIWQVLTRDFFQGEIRPEDTVLDLGCGFGEFLVGIQCARRIGVDANPDPAEVLAEGGVEFHRGSVCDLSFLGDGCVDLVFMSNLVEHLPDKAHIEQMLREAFRVIRPSGRLVVMGPNLRLLPVCYWDFWDHQVPLTDLAMEEVLELTGFRVVERIARFLPYTTRSRMPQRPWIVRWYLRMPWLWRLFGRQFLIRARKPAE